MLVLAKQRSVQVVVAIAVGCVAADVLWPAFRRLMNTHQIVAGVLTEALLLAAGYLVIDNLLERRAYERSAAVAASAISQLEGAALGIRTMIVLPLWMRRDWLTTRPGDAPTDGEVIERLPAFLRSGAAESGLEGGLDGFVQRVKEQVQALRTAFATWAPGLVGNPTLDPLLNLVPQLIKKGADIEFALLRAQGVLTIADMLAEDPDEHARQEAALAVGKYLEAYRKFERELEKHGFSRSRGEE
jgi:hypothetical protein